MLVLGIESSCDETAAAVVDAELRVLSNVISSQIPVHAKYGGVVPELASRNHVMAVVPVLKRALQEADATLDDLDAIAVTRGPGLIGSLLIGLQTAKTLAWVRGLPLVGVDHVEAHIHAIFLRDDALLPDDAPRPEAPYAALAVSGGHSSVYRVDEQGHTKLIAHTLDDAAGEAFDKVAKILGLPYPGGVAIDQLSPQGDPEAIPFSKPIRQRDRHVFSFSGLKTAARLAIDKLPTPLSEGTVADVAASFQEAVVEHLVRKTMQAVAALGLDQLVVAGGVAANRRLRAVFTEACDRQGVKLFLTPTAWCTDNAAMVAGLGLRLFQRGEGRMGAEAITLDAYANRSFISGTKRG